METTEKSSDLLARLRNVTLEDELELSDLWPKDNSMTETHSESAFGSDPFSSLGSSWNDFRSSSSTGSFLDSGSKTDFQSESALKFKSDPEPGIASFSSGSLSGAGPVENRENPFARMSRQGSGVTSDLPKKLGGWLMSTSCFGILGVVCGGSLAAWSLLASSGTHSMTALGFSLTISGLLMLVSVGVSQMVLSFSGQS